jgi:hypothetical protein
MSPLRTILPCNPHLPLCLHPPSSLQVQQCNSIKNGRRRGIASQPEPLTYVTPPRCAPLSSSQALLPHSASGQTRAECRHKLRHRQRSWVRHVERITPTERQPFVSDVSANFLARGQRDGFLRPYSRFSRPEPLFFLSSSSSVVLTRLSGPRSRHCTSQENWLRLYRTRTSGSVARNSEH